LSFALLHIFAWRSDARRDPTGSFDSEGCQARREAGVALILAGFKGVHC